jgi:hypothetical protein
MFRPARILVMTALVITGLGFGLTNSAEAAPGRGSGGRTASSYRHGYRHGHRHGYRHHGHHRYHHRHHHRYDYRYWYRYPRWYRYGEYSYVAPAETGVAPTRVAALTEPEIVDEPASPPEPSFEPEAPVVRPAVRPVAKPVTKPKTTIIQSVKVVKPKVVK